MRYVALSIDKGRMSRLRRILPGVEVFQGVAGCHDDYRSVCIPLAYRDAAIHGHTQGWGKETVFMQDDVWIPHGAVDAWLATYSEPLVILGRTESSGIVVPKAFLGTPEIWELLTGVWIGEGRIGPAWMPLVEEYGIVLDVTQNLGG